MIRPATLLSERRISILSSTSLDNFGTSWPGGPETLCRTRSKGLGEGVFVIDGGCTDTDGGRKGGVASLGGVGSGISSTSSMALRSAAPVSSIECRKRSTSLQSYIVSEMDL